MEGVLDPAARPIGDPAPSLTPLTPRSAPGRQVGLELLQPLLQKEHELNLRGCYHRPLLGTLAYSVSR